MSILLAAKDRLARGRILLPAAGLAAITLPLLATPAEAHVKWFAPYIVGSGAERMVH